MVNMWSAIFLALALSVTTGQKVEDVLVGHLKPLGEQIPPTVKIDEVDIDSMPTPKEFFDNYMQDTKALIFRGVIKDTRAYKLWTDEFLKENYPELEVRLEAKKETDHFTPIGETYIGRDNIRHFVDNYHSNNHYIVSELPSPMYKDCGVIPSVGACGAMKEQFVEIDIWWSGGDSSSIIHKDAYNQINCLVNGTKYWKLFEYKYEKYLHKHWEPENQVGGFSDINVKAVNLKKHPNITKVPWSNFTINAGDCLYLPKSYYHQVESVGTNNLAVSILFGRFDQSELADFSDCTDETDYKTFHTLDKFDIDWIWPGKGTMTMGKTDIFSVKSEVVKTVKSLAENGIEFTVDLMHHFGLQNKKAEKAMELLDKNKDKIVSVEEAEGSGKPEMREYANMMEEREPSNDYLFEYSVIPYDKVISLLMRYMRAKPLLKRETWLKVYQKHAQGTKKFGNEVFTRLVDSEDINEISSAEINRDKLFHALKNWRSYFAPQYSELGLQNVRDIDIYLKLIKGRIRSEDEEDEEEEREGDDEDEEEEGDEEDEEQSDDDSEMDEEEQNVNERNNEDKTDSREAGMREMQEGLREQENLYNILDEEELYSSKNKKDEL